jgi:ABC-type transport system involved in multi-copper enzyme maturation permease subunit
MIWLTWRQFRASAIVATVTVAVIAVGLATTHPGGSGYLSHDHLLKFFSTLLVGVPALIGAFWGAPLIATELESGTYRLVWTQSVTRAQWLAVKLAVIGLASVAIAGLLSLVLGIWSSSTVDQDRFGSAMFAQRGIAPIGYAAFGLALGVTMGLLIRRTLPAMATTLVAFLAVRIIVQSFVRPHFATAIKLVGALSAENGAPLQARPGTWVVSDNVFDSAGHLVNNIRCGPDARACMSQYHQILTYQPASRYWAFQTYETAIFIVLALILIGLCFRWIRTRLT